MFPAGTCLDRDFCCKIVPSLTLGHYLHSISPYSINIFPLYSQALIDRTFGDFWAEKHAMWYVSMIMQDVSMIMQDVSMIMQDVPMSMQDVSMSMQDVSVISLDKMAEM